jgi:chlorite dismutase
MTARMFSFIGGNTGSWRVIKMETITGNALPAALSLDVITNEDLFPTIAPSWALRGMTSNERYVTRDEKSELIAKQAGLGRTSATYAALIPIRKSAAWWALSQDERRKILADSSQHIQIGLRYLPAIARRLHHCRDISDREPFDFLTWFEYAPEDEEAFNSLVCDLRATHEWDFVDREIDIRLVRHDLPNEIG